MLLAYVAIMPLRKVPWMDGTPLPPLAYTRWWNG